MSKRILKNPRKEFLIIRQEQIADRSDVDVIVESFAILKQLRILQVHLSSDLEKIILQFLESLKDSSKMTKYTAEVLE